MVGDDDVIHYGRHDDYDVVKVIPNCHYLLVTPTHLQSPDSRLVARRVRLARRRL